MAVRWAIHAGSLKRRVVYATDGLRSSFVWIGGLLAAFCREMDSSSSVHGNHTGVFLVGLGNGHTSSEQNAWSAWDLPDWWQYRFDAAGTVAESRNFRLLPWHNMLIDSERSNELVHFHSSVWVSLGTVAVRWRISCSETIFANVNTDVTKIEKKLSKKLHLINRRREHALYWV